jgi:beta-alanine--pyruvate transaminase
MTLNVAPPARSNGVNLENFWMPFTANRQFKASPRILVSAEGMYYRSDDGRSVIDGTSGLWCVNAGHARREIAQAVERQLHTLDFAPTFQMGRPIATRLKQSPATDWHRWTWRRSSLGATG